MKLHTLSVERLRTYKLVYLATPYSKYPTGIVCAFEDAARLAAQLLKRGIHSYSPIAHTHPIAIFGGIDPLDHGVWLAFDQAMMDAADALLVAKMPSWEISYGIKHEIDYFAKAGKPIFELDPETFEVIARFGDG